MENFILDPFWANRIKTNFYQRNQFTSLCHYKLHGKSSKYQFLIKLDKLNLGTIQSLCPLFFIKFLLFLQMIALQKLEKMFFISSKKFFSFLRYSIFCNFSLPFQTFHIQQDKWKWNNVWCHELTCINLQM